MLRSTIFSACSIKTINRGLFLALVSYLYCNYQDEYGRYYGTEQLVIGGAMPLLVYCCVVRA